MTFKTLCLVNFHRLVYSVMQDFSGSWMPLAIIPLTLLSYTLEASQGISSSFSEASHRWNMMNARKKVLQLAGCLDRLVLVAS